MYITYQVRQTPSSGFGTSQVLTPHALATPLTSEDQWPWRELRLSGDPKLPPSARSFCGSRSVDAVGLPTASLEGTYPIRVHVLSAISTMRLLVTS